MGEFIIYCNQFPVKQFDQILSGAKPEKMRKKLVVITLCIDHSIHVIWGLNFYK